jgi:hypothetical protein
MLLPKYALDGPEVAALWLAEILASFNVRLFRMILR